MESFYEGFKIYIDGKLAVSFYSQAEWRVAHKKILSDYPNSVIQTNVKI